MSSGADRPGERTEQQEEPALDLSSRLALRPKEAAEALGISERTLRQLLPELPVVRRGGVVLLPVEPLRAWLRDQVTIEGRRADAIVGEIMAAIRNDRGDHSE
jgi:excisionase family DNA binding protein